MPLDPRSQRLLDMLALSGTRAQTSAERREDYRKLMAMAEAPVPILATSEHVTDGGIPLRCYGPEGATAVLVFFHGGGLVAGSVDTHDGMCRRLAAASGAKVMSVGYRLAPEAKFPASLDDAHSALVWVHENSGSLGLDRSQMAIGGDSAGALLAALIATGARKSSIPLRAQLLLCPVVNLAKANGSRAEFATGYLIDRQTNAQDIASCFERGEELPLPLPSPGIIAPPPTIIHAAEYDPFRDEAEELANMLRASGVPVEFTCHAGMVHSFYGLPAFFPQADTTLRQAGAQLARYFV